MSANSNTKLPNFFLAGTPKSGTTTLFELLKQHPQCFIPDVKTIEYFNSSRYNGEIGSYTQYFNDVQSHHKAVGDMSLYYYYHDDAPKRIVDKLGPNLKFIFIYREPVSRAISGFWHVKRLNIEKHFNFIEERSFEDVFHIKATSSAELVIKEAENLNDSINQNKVFPQFINADYEEKTAPLYYLRNSFYAKYLKNFLNVIDRENMMFLCLEEYKKSPERHLKAIFQFLEIEDNFLPMDFKKSFNIGFIPKNNQMAKLIHFIEPYMKYKSPWIHRLIEDYYYEYLFTPRPKTDTKVLSYLKDFFKEDVMELSQITGVNFTHYWNY